MRTIPKGNNASAADLVRLAQTYGATFRVNAKREIFLRGSRKLPALLIEKLGERKEAVREHVTQTATSFVWSVSVDGKNARVIDPGRSTQTDFETAMRMKFGSSRVGACRRLWPEENRDE